MNKAREHFDDSDSWREWCRGAIKTADEQSGREVRSDGDVRKLIGMAAKEKAHGQEKGKNAEQMRKARAHKGDVCAEGEQTKADDSPDGYGGGEYVHTTSSPSSRASAGARGMFP
jgi:hypothetical protein